MRPAINRRLKESIMLQEDAGLLLDTYTGRVLELNNTACVMVKHLNNPGGDIMAKLQEEFNGIDKEVIQADLSELMSRLAELGFLESIQEPK